MNTDKKELAKKAKSIRNDLSLFIGKKLPAYIDKKKLKKELVQLAEYVLKDM